MTGSRFLQQKPGYPLTQVAPARVSPIAALSKFAGAVAHHAPILSRFAAKVAAHVHLPHLHMPHTLWDLPGQLWRRALHRPAPDPQEGRPAETPERPLKPRFNKPSGPKA